MQIQGNEVLLPMRASEFEQFPEGSMATLVFENKWIEYYLRTDCKKLIFENEEDEEGSFVDSKIDQVVMIPYSSISRIDILIQAESEVVNSFVFGVKTHDGDGINLFLQFRKDAKQLARMILEKKANDAKGNHQG